VAAARIQEAYPGISILGTFNGYIPQNALVGAVRALNPPVVLCGMGVPRQEAFLVALADAGWIGAGFTCGGYLDHLSERFNFYPAIINRLNLRWLYRLAREPRRIGYRCVVEYAPFWRTVTWKLVQTILHMPSRGPG
jgi:N-acetylglucosaminyldiphosphoundecaprenol N-acetyl-beta-D-mannosaminyltransferase